MGGGLAYLTLTGYSRDTALAGSLIWVGLGIINLVAFRLIQRGEVRLILYATMIKLLLALILIGAVALALQPALRPTLLNAVLAILVMQGLHMVLSL